jgi:hypothetical protein
VKKLMQISGFMALLLGFFSSANALPASFDAPVPAPHQSRQVMPDTDNNHAEHREQRRDHIPQERAKYSAHQRQVNQLYQRIEMRRHAVGNW